MRVALCFLALSLLSTAVGCGADDPPSAEASDVDDLTASGFAGTYEAATSQDDDFFGSVKVVKQGARLSVELDGESHPLSRTPSGAFVFSHEEGVLVNPCDNPGCGDMVKVSGVLFLKTLEDNTKQAQIKLTVTEEFSHPESEEDREGLFTTTVRWVKPR
jgi:hypothetical protein